MRVLLLLALFILPVSAQVTVEDFACQIPTSATAGNPTLVTCPGPLGHGYDNLRAWATIKAWGTSGSTITIGSRTYRFVSDLTGCVAGDVRVPVASEYGNSTNAAQSNRGAYLAAAIRGASGTWVMNSGAYSSWQSSENMYCPGTAAHPDVDAYWSFSSYEPIVVVQAKVGGAGGELPLSQTGGHILQYADRTTSLTSLKRHWRVKITGATDGWAGITSANRIAEVGPDSNTIRILYNSTTAGSWAGQSWTMIRMGWDGAKYAYHNSGDLPGPREIPLNGSLGIEMDGCTPSETDLTCAKAFLTPENQKGYGTYGNLSGGTLSVSGGTGTFTLASAWPNALAVDMRFYLRGFQKYFFQYNISTYADNGSGGTRVTTSTAHNCTAGVDQAHIANAVGVNAPSGAYGISVISTTQVDLTGKAYQAGWSGGILACNPHGRQAQNEATYYRTNPESKAYKIKTVNGQTITFDSLLADGVYTGSCVPAGSCTKSGMTTGYMAITGRTAPYLYIAPRTTPAGGTKYYPIDTLWWHSKNKVPTGTNRQIYWIKWPYDTYARGAYNVNFGTYPTTSALGGSHYYHQTDAGSAAGEWHKYYFTAAPSIQVGGNWAFPNEPATEPGHPYTPQYDGGSNPNHKYFDSSTITYLDATGAPGGGMPDTYFGYTTVYFGKIQAFRADREPDGFVRNMVIYHRANRWNGTEWVIDPGFNIGFDALQYDYDTQYYIRYSTVGSCKTLGWSNCTAAPSPIGIANPGGGYRTANWQSPTISPRPNTIWVGIRPKVAVLSSSLDGQPMWFYVRDELGVQSGDTVTVSGAGGNRDGVNRTVAEVVGRKIWQLDARTLGGWSNGTGPLLGVTASGGTCTANLREAHGIYPGQFISITGSTSASLGASDLSWGNMKKYIVASTPTTTSFTFSCSGVANGTYSTNLSGYRFAIWAYPGIRIDAIATGAPTSSGARLEATTENAAFTEIMLEPYDQTPDPPPNAPTGLACSGVSTSQIDCTWTDASTDETSFQIERGQGGSFTFQATLAAGSVSHSSTSLAEATVYQFRVRSCNAGGCSGWNGPVEASTNALNPIPTAPSALTVTRASNDIVALSWTDNSNNETFFEVDRGGSVTQLAAGTTTYIYTGLLPNTLYNFRVRATNGTGNSSYTTTSTTTDVDGNSRIEGVYSNAVRIVYSAPTPSIQCSLYTVDSAGVSSGTTNDTTGYIRRSTILTGLSPNTQYRAVVDCPGWASTQTFTTLTTGGGNITVKVGGRAPTGVDGLTVEYGATTALGSTVSTACVAGDLCYVSITGTEDSLIYARRKWTLSATTIKQSTITPIVLR